MFCRISGDLGDHIKRRFFSKLPPEDTKVRTRVHCNTRWSAIELVCSLWPFIAYMSMSLPTFYALPRCGGPHRSAMAAVTPDGSINWMAAGDLEPLWEGSSILARAEGKLEPLFGVLRPRPKNWIAAAYGGAVVFRGIVGPLVLSRCFQMLSGLSDVPTLTTRCGCRAATDHRINIAHLVLHLIWNGKLSPGKREPKRRGRQDYLCLLQGVD